MCCRGILIPAGKMGRKHLQATPGDQEPGPKAVENPAGIMWGACSILGLPALLLSSVQRPHLTPLPFDSPFSPAPNPSLRPVLTPPRQTHCRPSCLETHHLGSAGLSFGFPISPPSPCSLNTHPGAPMLPQIPSARPVSLLLPPKILPGASRAAEGKGCVPV